MMVTKSFTQPTLHTELKHYLQRRLKPYGITQFAYLVFPKSRPLYPLYLTNYPPEWVNSYQQQQLHLIDPVILTAKQRLAPFAWDDDAVLLHKAANRQVFELAQAYHISYGHTFVLRDYQGNLATLNLTTHHYDARLQEQHAQLHLLLLELHHKVLTL